MRCCAWYGDMVFHNIKYKKWYFLCICVALWLVHVGDRWHFLKEIIYSMTKSVQEVVQEVGDAMESKLSAGFTVEPTGPVCLIWKPFLNEINNSGEEGNKTSEQYLSSKLFFSIALFFNMGGIPIESQHPMEKGSYCQDRGVFMNL